MNSFSKLSIINSIIIIIWIILLLLNWITYFRLTIFIIILLLIFIYKILINKLENFNLLIKNYKLLNFLITVNKYRNPVLLLLIKLDIWMYNVIIYSNNKMLNLVVFIIYLLLINPAKIFYFKIYKILWIWKENKIHNILLNRMLGLILSVLIFANLIIYLKNTLNLNIIMIIYLYFLIISILCEVIETRDSKLLNIFLVNDISTKSVILSRIEVNLLSVILKKNNIDELHLNVSQVVINKIQKFKIGYTYYIIESLKFFENKPNYWVYSNLKLKLDIYLALRIDTYIFFQYYKWNVPDMHNNNIMRVSVNYDKEKLKEIYEYDYKVFKTLLFLYWDLEYYLEDLDYVKHTLIVDDGDLDFLSIKFNCSTKSEIVFLNKIKYKDSNNFWSCNWFNNIFKYDLYLKTKDSQLSMEDYKLKELFYNMVSNDEINNLIECQKDKIEPLYYESYIELWYQEWYSELNADLSIKYKDKINILDKDLRILKKILKKVK